MKAAERLSRGAGHGCLACCLLILSVGGEHGDAARAASAARPRLTLYAGDPGVAGSADGTAATARFYAPGGVATDRAGNLYVADTGNQTIRRITPSGTVTTLAGHAGQRGSTDGPGAAARFNVPSGICIDDDGNLYVADSYGSTIRKISPAGMVSTVAGSASERGSADGPGAAARFFLPQGIAVDGTRNVYVADTYNDTVRMISPAGVVTTLAGSPGQGGFTDGTGAAARFDLPSGIAVGARGELYVADQGNSVVRVITRGGSVRTIAGAGGESGLANGAGARARFREPFGIALDGLGNLYVTDTGNHAIRSVTPRGKVSTLVTGGSTWKTALGTRVARLSFPGGVAAVPADDLLLYLTDGNAILRIH